MSAPRVSAGLWILRIVSVGFIFWGLTMFVGRYKKAAAPPTAPVSTAPARPGQETPTALLTLFIRALNANDIETIRELTHPMVLAKLGTGSRWTGWIETLKAQLGSVTENDIVRIEKSRDAAGESAALYIRMKPVGAAAPVEGRVRVTKTDGSWYFAER